MTGTHFETRRDVGRRLAVVAGCRFGIPTAVATVSPHSDDIADVVAHAFARPLVHLHCEPLELAWSLPAGLEFGAVDEDGRMVLDYGLLAACRIGNEEIDDARRRARERWSGRHEARARGTSLAPSTPRLLLVGERLDPGWPMEAAVSLARRRGVRRLFVASVWASRGAAQWFAADVHGFVSLEVEGDQANAAWRRRAELAAVR